ncbi:unnamed protein product, partial [Durusdinium trenchii]
MQSPVRSESDSKAECIRLQYALQRMKTLMREERARWHEERMQLMQELAATKQALSQAQASDDISVSGRRRHQFGSSSLRSEIVEIDALKNNVRAALDAMNAIPYATHPSLSIHKQPTIMDIPLN